MATKIVTKNSSTASAVPTASDLVQGELAVNVADKRLFTEDNAGAIVELGTNPSTIDINAGTIDGTAIGASSASTGAFTTLTATGIDVTGTATMDGLTVDKSSQATIVATSDSTVDVRLVADTSLTEGSIRTSGTTPNLGFYVGGTKYANISDGGDISFYEDTGTTPKLFWDASAESLGIGTSSPSAKCLELQPPAQITDFSSNILNIGGQEADDAVGTKSGIGFGYTSTSIPAAPATIGFETINTSGGTYGDLYFATRATTGTEQPTERMRIDSAGNVGIGTSSPSAKIHATTATAGYAAKLINTNGASDANGLLIQAGTVSSEYALNVTNTAGTTNFMVVKGNGNVGIGTSSPSANLDVLSSSNQVISNFAHPSASTASVNGGALVRIQNTNATNGNQSSLIFADSSAVASSGIFGFNTNHSTHEGYMVFGTRNSGGSFAERMRIDSAGNLLVGTTSASIYNDTSGNGIQLNGGSGQIVVAKQSSSASDPALWLNNTGVDGSIVTFAKDGTTVGSIGVNAGSIAFGQSNTALGAFNTDRILFPATATGAVQDNQIDLGYANGRFKDLHLSGNALITTDSGVSKYFNVKDGTLGGDIRLGIESGVNNDGFVGTFTNNNFLFYTKSLERMRIDESGNLLIGKTANNLTSDGIVLRNGGELFVTRANDVATFNRRVSDGDIIRFARDAVTVGAIGSTSTFTYLVGQNSGVAVGGSTAAIIPVNGSGAFTDNSYDIGNSSYRFDDIYATNGTIQTSDRNEKQDIEELSDAEQRVAVAAKGLLRKFRWKDSVAEKGDEARVHFGIIAQDLQAAFAAEGLDAGDYAMFISTLWTDEETNEEKTRMGVRYSELLAFIISAI